MAKRTGSGSNAVTGGMSVWAKIALGFIGVCALFAIVTKFTGGNGSAPALPQYTPNVLRQATTDTGTPVLAITTTVAPGLEAKTYEGVLRDIVKKSFAGKNGNVWVFDDLEAEKLQWIPLTTDLTQQQQDYYDAHLRAMTTVVGGEITKVATY
ncbi:MAG: hypothetical protein WCP21_05795 [Armatimonadota bacterium]